MVVWSSLKPLFTNSSAKIIKNAILRRPMSGDHHRVLPLQSSKWQWLKFKELVHFYVWLGLIPISLTILYSNIFIGPATLSEIPEDYEPKYWEYYRHPITRFIARYILNNPQQDYEKYLHHIHEEEEKKNLRSIDEKIKKQMAEREDYQAYYYRPVVGKHSRAVREVAEKTVALAGD